jgi:hypothetical protein
MSKHPGINKAWCRKFMLEYAGRSRHHKFERVAESSYDILMHKLRDAMRNLVDQQPSKGKTIR